MGVFKYSINKLLIACILITGTFIPTNAATTSPSLNSVYFNTSSASLGDKVFIYADFSDSNGISYGNVSLYRKDGSFFNSFYMSLNSTSGLLEASFQVTQFMPNYLYIGEVDGYNNIGGSSKNYNSTDFSNVGINILSTTPDTTPPSLTYNNFEFFQGFNAVYGTDNQVSLDAFDDKSGVATVYADIINAVNQTFLFRINLTFDSSVPWWHGSFHINSTLPSEIAVKGIYLCDKANNSVYLINGLDFSAFSLHIDYIEDNNVTLNISPNNGTSDINSFVVFSYTIQSFFDLPNAHVELIGHYLNEANVTLDKADLYINGGGSEKGPLTYFFKKSGTFIGSLILYDDLKPSVTWSTLFKWTINQVNENTAISDTGLSNSSNQASNSYQLPILNFNTALISFFNLFLIDRKKFKIRNLKKKAEL